MVKKNKNHGKSARKRAAEPGAHGADRVAIPAYVAPIRERQAAGRDLARHYPLKQHGVWRPAERKHDPIDLLIESSKGRVEHLVPIRYGRMLTGPFAFYRGSAAIMAADLSRTPSTGVRVQACGDCHAVNFGGFATPERRVIFDINDFDETSLAPWEWDVKRLVASFILGGRSNALFSPDDARECAWRAARAYRKRMAKYAEMPVLQSWYDSIPIETVLAGIESEELKKKYQKKLEESAETSSHRIEFADLAAQTRPEPRIRDQPPLIFHMGSMEHEKFRTVIEESYRRYTQSVSPSVREILSRYRLVDVAAKVVGVGSVGTLCGIILLMSGSGDPLFLQFKEARKSVLEAYAGASPYKHDGERIVHGQRQMQAASDMFLGWMTGAGKDHRSFYVRQLNDVKLKPRMELAVPSGTKEYARICGQTLARAHVRSGDPVLLGSYMGESDAFEDAMADFAVAYADQAERDHQAMVAAVRAGRIEAELGV
jgi:uncharacterized protein (DUF2252 family)